MPLHFVLRIIDYTEYSQYYSSMTAMKNLAAKSKFDQPISQRVGLFTSFNFVSVFGRYELIKRSN